MFRCCSAVVIAVVSSDNSHAFPRRIVKQHSYSSGERKGHGRTKALQTHIVVNTHRKKNLKKRSKKRGKKNALKRALACQLRNPLTALSPKALTLAHKQSNEEETGERNGTGGGERE